MFNDLRDDQTILVCDGRDEVYFGRVGDMPDDMRNSNELSLASFYLLADVEDADVIAII